MDTVVSKIAGMSPVMFTAVMIGGIVLLVEAIADRIVPEDVYDQFGITDNMVWQHMEIDEAGKESYSTADVEYEKIVEVDERANFLVQILTLGQFGNGKNAQDEKRAAKSEMRKKDVPQKQTLPITHRMVLPAEAHHAKKN